MADRKKIELLTKDPKSSIADLFLAWLETANQYMNQEIRKSAFQEILNRLIRENGKRILSCEYPNGSKGYVVNPKGILVLEVWEKPHDAAKGMMSFKFMQIAGYGSTAGSAFIQGKCLPKIQPSANPLSETEFRYYFYNINSMQLFGNTYAPESYRLNQRAGLLEKTLDY